MRDFLQSYFKKEFVSVNMAAYLVGAATFISMLLSLLRDRLLLSTVGLGEELDIYYAAFKLPDLLFTIFISLISVFVIIPILDKKEKKEARIFLDSLLKSVLFSSLLIAAVAALFTPLYLNLFFHNLYTGGFSQDFVFVARLLLLQFVILALSQLFLAVAQHKKRFLSYSVAAILYNLGIIFGIIFFYPSFGLKGLAFGVLLGALLQMTLSFWASDIQIHKRISINTKEIFLMLKNSYPRALSLFLQQASILFLFAFLSSQASGSLSAFQIALTLQAAPFSVIALSYSVAAFPTLSKLFSSGRKEEFIAQVKQAISFLIFWSLPIIFLAVVLRDYLISVIFMSSKFSWQDLYLVSFIFVFLLLSLLPQALSVLLSRVYYAADNTLSPLLLHLISFPAFIFLLYGLAFLFEFPIFKTFLNNFTESLLLTPVAGYIWAVSLAYFFASVLGAFLFIYKFKKDFELKSILPRRLLRQSFLSSFLAAMPIFLTLRFLDIQSLKFAQRLAVLLFSSLLFLLIWYLLLYIQGNLELKELIRILKGRCSRRKT